MSTEAAEVDSNASQKINRVTLKSSEKEFLIDFELDLMFSRALVSSRSVVEISGADAWKFLQGLWTNDTTMLTARGSAQYGCFLNPKGRVLFDAVVSVDSIETNRPAETFLDSVSDGRLFVEVDCLQVPFVLQHFQEYKLRNQVHFRARSDLSVVARDPCAELQEEEIFSKPLLEFADPRAVALGDLRRQICEACPPEVAAHPQVAMDNHGYTQYLMMRGVADGEKCFVAGKSLPFEGNLDLLGGVSFVKGCYVGQELTHRAHTQLVTRKRIVPLELVGKDITEQVEEALALNSQHLAANLRTLTSKLWGAPGLDNKLFGSGSTDRSVGHLLSAAGEFGVGLIRLNEIDHKDQSSRFVSQVTNRCDVEAKIPSWWPDGAFEAALR